MSKVDKKIVIEEIAYRVDQIKDKRREIRHLQDELAHIILDGSITLEEALMAGIVKCNFPTPRYFNRILREKLEVTKDG